MFELPFVALLALRVYGGADVRFFRAGQLRCVIVPAKWGPICPILLLRFYHRRSGKADCFTPSASTCFWSICFERVSIRRSGVQFLVSFFRDVYTVFYRRCVVSFSFGVILWRLWWFSIVVRSRGSVYRFCRLILSMCGRGGGGWAAERALQTTRYQATPFVPRDSGRRRMSFLYDTIFPSFLLFSFSDSWSSHGFNCSLLAPLPRECTSESILS